MASDPRACVATHALTQSNHEPTADAKPEATHGHSRLLTDTTAAVVPLPELHPLARVRALRTMAGRTPGVDRVGREVLTALALRTDADGVAMVGQVRIATEAGCCERTARSRLATLARVGLIHRTRTGPRGLTLYTIATPTLDALDGPTAARIVANGQTGTDAPANRPGRTPAPRTDPDNPDTSAGNPDTRTEGQTGTANALDARQRPPAPGEGIGTEPPAIARQDAPAPATGDEGTGTAEPRATVGTGIPDALTTPENQTGTEPAAVPSNPGQARTGHDPVRPAPPVFVHPARPARDVAAKGSEPKVSTPRTGGDELSAAAIQSAMAQGSRGRVPTALGAARARVLERLAIAHHLAVGQFETLGRWLLPTAEGGGGGADGLRIGYPSLDWMLGDDGTRLLERLERAGRWHTDRTRRTTRDGDALAALRREPTGPRVTAGDVAALRTRLARGQAVTFDLTDGEAIAAAG